MLDPDPGRAHDLARAHVGTYLARGGAHVKDMLRFGSTEDELSGAPARRVVDALVAGGGPGALDAVAERVRAHVDAGADHVCLQVLTARPGVAPVAEWRELAALGVPAA